MRGEGKARSQHKQNREVVVASKNLAAQYSLTCSSQINTEATSTRR